MADSVPARLAVVSAQRNLTYSELDERANRLANHLLSLGVKRGDNVAVHAYNGLEWVDAFFACPKIGAVAINVNYKYLRDELIHLYQNSGSVAAIVGPTFVDAVAEVRAELPGLEHVLVIGEEYDASVAAASPDRPQVERSPDDRYIIYTGGTTGRPKGVVWRQEDIIKSALSALRFGVPVESVEGLGEDAQKNESPVRLSTCGPMMHGGSQWILGNCLVAGSTFVLYTEPSFDPHKMLDLAASAKVQMLAVLGDAMARPIAEALLAEPDRWDTSELFAISNGAAPLSTPVREQLRAALPG
ncbi:MAG: AMP-binding protein, partial [Nocardioides sp.]|nr:AMP-binding protein [Nocardioides sp.]